jgi:outer membrane protein assembly factor BamB
MLKKAVLAILGLVIVGAVFTAAGFRIERGGSGWPRFIVRSNDAALEADRAQQKSAATPGLEKKDPAYEAVASQEAAPAAPAAPNASDASTSAPTSQIATVDKPNAPDSSWTDFRGRNRDGRYTGAIRTSWPREGLRRLWKQPIGAGYASFVVADGRAFTIEQRRDQEVVAAYDVQTGRELWTNAWNASFEESMGGDGPRATPTYHDGRIYALGAEGELRVLDAAKGTLVWRRNILSENGAYNLSWGMSAAPLIVDDTVIVLPGGTRGSSVVAYKKATGDPVWKALNDEASYTSPMLVTLGGVRQLLVVTATRVVGLTTSG